MQKLAKSIDHINTSITNLHGQILKVEPHSESYGTLISEMHSLQTRKEVLKKYSAERVEQVTEVNADINNRLKKVTKELESERDERLSDIEHAIEDKLKELPALNGTPEDGLVSSDNENLKLVTRFINKYSNDNATVPMEKKFFHASACSNWDKYVFTGNDDKIVEMTNDLWMRAELSSATPFPLSIVDINRMIRSPGYEKYFFVILDTSLQAILTNATYNDSQFYEFIIIYDAQTRKFAPVPHKNKTNKWFCRKCFRYLPDSHECKHQCPICLRTGDDINCSKHLPGSALKTCQKCSAKCHTNDCFLAHEKICPRPPVSEMHGDIMELFSSLGIWNDSEL